MCICIACQKIGIESDADIRLGIRPVIVLNDKLKGTKENDVWKIN